MAHFLQFDEDQVKKLLLSETIIQERKVVSISGSQVRNEVDVAEPGLLVGRSWHGSHPLNALSTSEVRAMKHEVKFADGAALYEPPLVLSSSTEQTMPAARADLQLAGHNAYHPDAERNA